MTASPGQSVRAERFDQGEYLSGQKGQTVNLVAYAFTGSNPVSPTVRNAARLLYLCNVSVYSGGVCGELRA